MSVMGHDGRRSVTAMVIGMLAIAPVGAQARTKHKPAPKPATHAEKCEQAPAGGKGRVAEQQLTYTRECFDEFEKGIAETLQAQTSLATACPDLPPAGRSSAADGLQKLAKAGEKDVELTKKAKAGYFRAEREWYAEHRKVKHHELIADKLDSVVDGLGKATFQMSGVYADMEGIASALRNNDCPEASSHLSAAESALGKTKDRVAELRGFIGELRAALNK
jgi:hypothetical protein